MNDFTSVISIVTRLPPAIDGIGDYAFNLARQLRQDTGIDTHFIVSSPIWQGASEIEGFSVSQVSGRSSNALLELLEGKSTILLHYVPHGHAKKGCPFWLIQALETWKRQTDDAELIIMFHEVFSMGKGVVPWNTDFWLLPFQKQITMRLARLSDRCLTSSQHYAELLCQFRQAPLHSIPILPVPSGIGEPSQVPLLRDRQRRLIVFGQGGNKRNAYEAVAQIHQICQTLKIEEIWDIGPDADCAIPTIDEVRVVKAGKLNASEVSEVLLNSIAGFLSYDPNRLSKSSIFAAYCSHGIIPINTAGTTSPANGLTANQHYWVPNQNSHTNTISEFQAIADHAREWYLTHGLVNQAKIFAAKITDQKLQDTTLLRQRIPLRED